MSEINVEEWLKKRYGIRCPFCEDGMQATRSLGMLMFGMTEGYGTCPKCKKHIQLKWDKENDILTAGVDYVTDKLNGVKVEELN